MHSDQIEIDTDTARRMIADQFPRFRHGRIRRLPQLGTVNAIFRIGSAAAARFPLRKGDPEECLDRLRNEAAAMTEFAEHAPVAAPLPLGIGRPDSGYPMPWSAQTWIDGTVATPTGLAASTSFARDIADLILSLRAADVDGRRFDGQGRGGVLRDHDEWMETCFRHSEGLLDVPGVRRVWARLRLLPASETDMMCHRDLIPMNLLVRGDRLVGVLDSGSFGPADPALDLVSAWHLFDRPRRDLLRARVGSGSVEWQRGAAWAFQQAMGLVWYYRTSNPPMSSLGAMTISRLVEDPEIAA